MKNPFKIVKLTNGLYLRINLLLVTSYNGDGAGTHIFMADSDTSISVSISLSDFEKVIEAYFGDLVTYATEI